MICAEMIMIIRIVIMVENCTMSIRWKLQNTIVDLPRPILATSKHGADRSVAI
jgi:hypothetical protein